MPKKGKGKQAQASSHVERSPQTDALPQVWLPNEVFQSYLVWAGQTRQPNKHVYNYSCWTDRGKGATVKSSLEYGCHTLLAPRLTHITHIIIQGAAIYMHSKNRSVCVQTN